MTDKMHPFFWYELMTTDVAAAEAFYGSVVGWRSEPFVGGEGYVVLNAPDTSVAGIMAISGDAAGMPPMWLGYIYTDDVDAATAGVQQAGGSVHRPPTDIPGVGRFSVVADPQGAVFMLMAPSTDAPAERPDPMAVGHVGWRELYASDWKQAFDFYSGQFSWSKAEAMDMGPMGTYQLFESGPDQRGGMMTRPAEVPAPFWQFYFTVDALDAAVERVKAGGGKLLNEPMEVPGGSWVASCMDPQGAMFSLTAAKR
jgi:predicted enzyme related to lactoylglutathione lyase